MLLKNWFYKGPSNQQLISFDHHDIVTGLAFTAQVASLYEQLSHHQEQRWLLSSDRSDLFAIGLCAGLLAGKRLILPANTQQGHLEQLHDQFDGVLSDVELYQDRALLLLKKEPCVTDAIWPKTQQLGELVIFTSGSSGEPKAITKTIDQFDAEVSVLEQTFAAHLPHCSVISTVSHQHIYGLLFKILWPLAASRPFLSNLVEYPETLTYYTNLFPNLCLISSPAQLSRLPDALEHQRQLHSPSLVFSSGGLLSHQASTGIAECYGKPPIEVYGSTETGGIAYRYQNHDNQPWRTFSSHQIKQDEQDGALLLKSPYLDTTDWLKCDDQIDLVNVNEFHLKGRLDRIVKIEEKRLSLAQMEVELCNHPIVAEAALVLLEQPRVQLGAVIVLTEQGEKLLDTNGKLAINNLLKGHLLTQFERVTFPRRWRYQAQLPLNTQGKQLRHELMKLF